MNNSQTCPCTKSCPLKNAMDAIGGKWKLSILCSLNADGTTRYNELKRKMKGISNTMLAKSLKELEECGLVRRTEHMEVPIRVEYTPTDLASELIPILGSLAQWGVRMNLQKSKQTD